MAGEKKVVAAGAVPQSICSTTDHRFTMLPIASALAEAVCCVLIFQTETGEVPLQWRHGHDKTIALIRDADGEIAFEANKGEGKVYPFGPTCKFNGKVILCLCYASKSDGITAEILDEVLTELDLREVFPREEDVIPVFLINHALFGHTKL